MQAIARVNRVFKEKPGGLLVDYIGIATNLKKALAQYSQSDRDKTGIDEEEAVAVLLRNTRSSGACSPGMTTAWVSRASLPSG